jgi:hypothetical protein
MGSALITKLFLPGVFATGPLSFAAAVMIAAAILSFLVPS